ncbi:MAG: SpoIIE family protein phosphatase [Acidobacteria bacterium]|nr:SpoIIE family protein phosphatase [Acidobacteriota bacterium]
MMSETEKAKLKRLEAENHRLRSAVEELSILNEVATTVSSANSLGNIVELVVQKCVKHLSVEQAAVLMLGDKDEAAALHTMVRKVQADITTNPYRLGDQVIGWMIKNQAPLVINDVATDERFHSPTLQPDGVVTSLMCVPLRQKGRLLGVLSAFNKRGSEGFTESDQRLLTIIAAQSAQVIENARLGEEEKALQLMQQELRMAHGIQLKLLPKEPPSIPGFQIAGRSLAARNVGGDYYDFYRSGDNYAICLGDVSGKGMPAALLMACVQATIRGQTLVESSVANCLERSNRLLYEITESDKFVTLFFALLDPVARRLCYSNAGHNPPILLSDKQVLPLDVGGPVLSILPACPYEEAQLDLHSGDLLVIYSDGFSEAMNRRFEEFGEGRLLELVKKHGDLSPDALIEEAFKIVKQHTGDAPQTDDMTIVVVKVE